VREVTGERDYETWFMANKEYQMPSADVAFIERELVSKNTH
jgi:hypothetical protein